MSAARIAPKLLMRNVSTSRSRSRSLRKRSKTKCLRHLGASRLGDWTWR